MVRLVVLLKIPEERIPVLIGKNGEIKKEIEFRGRCKLNISKDGNVTVEAGEPTEEWKIRDIVRSIARGFNPKIAMKLFSDEFYLEVINLRDYLKNENAMQRQKARIIGTGGKTKETIEELAGVYLSIYGHTVAIIGDEWGIKTTKEAIMMFLEGKSHSTVYTYLEKQSKLNKMFLGYEEV